jgi:hypothetical protein
VKNVCSNKEMRPSIEFGGIYVFSYSGNDKVAITDFKISFDECGFGHIAPTIK